MFTGLRIQLRIVAALVLREARVRHGRSRFGYTWAIVEPAALVILLTFLFSQFRSGSGATANFALFFATGVLPFQMFRSTTQYVSNAIMGNRPLFNYLPVHPIDAVIARTVLDISTGMAVMVIVLGFQVLVQDAPMPADVPGLLLIVFLIALLAFGGGLCLAICLRLAPLIPRIYGVIMGPAFFLSCVFYSLQAVPTRFREILVWNPLVHAVEGYRVSYFVGYRAPDVDLFYLFCWGAILTFLGLLAEFGVKNMRVA